MTRARCQLTFLTSRNRQRVVSINDPRPNLQWDTVNIAAGALMLANPFNEETGLLTELLNVAVVAETRNYIIEDAEAEAA